MTSSSPRTRRLLSYTLRWPTALRPPCRRPPRPSKMRRRGIGWSAGGWSRYGVFWRFLAFWGSPGAVFHRRGRSYLRCCGVLSSIKCTKLLDFWSLGPPKITHIGVDLTPKKEMAWVPLIFASEYVEKCIGPAPNRESTTPPPGKVLTPPHRAVSTTQFPPASSPCESHGNLID